TPASYGQDDLLETAGNARVRDGGGFFKPETIKQANEILNEIKKRDHRDVVVETYATVPAGKDNEVKDKESRERFFKSWAASRARDLDLNGILILICKNPGHLEIEVGNKTSHVFNDEHRATLRRMLLKSFNEKEYDSGLLEGLQYVQRTFNAGTSSSGGR